MEDKNISEACNLDISSHHSNSPPLQYIVWDWNGTLLDDISASLAAINMMLRKWNLPGVTLEKYREIFNFPVRPCYEIMGFDVSREEIWDKVAREFHDNYREAARDIPLRDGIIDLLNSLSSSGIPMSVLSASEQGVLECMVSTRNISHYFKSLYGTSDHYGGSKMEVAQQLISNVGIAPRHILLIGDTTHDHKVAQALGCRCILLTGGHQSEQRLRSCGCEVISSPQELREVLGA